MYAKTQVIMNEQLGTQDECVQTIVTNEIAKQSL